MSLSSPRSLKTKQAEVRSKLEKLNQEVAKKEAEKNAALCKTIAADVENMRTTAAGGSTIPTQAGGTSPPTSTDPKAVVQDPNKQQCGPAELASAIGTKTGKPVDQMTVRNLVPNDPSTPKDESKDPNAPTTTSEMVVAAQRTGVFNTVQGFQGNANANTVQQILEGGGQAMFMVPNGPGYHWLKAESVDKDGNLLVRDSLQGGKLIAMTKDEINQKMAGAGGQAISLM